MAAAALILVVFSSAVRADADFELWLKQLWFDAQQRGVSQATFDGAMKGLQLDLSLPDLVIPGRPLKEQAEFVKLPADYLPEQQLSGLAKAGRRHLLFYKSTLQKIEAEYGVPGNIAIAVWGRETDYGAERQRHNVIRSLATQAYLGRRKDMFRDELLIALKLVQSGTIRMDAMGSWSGAMGQTQFEPSDFEKFAVDGDGDGKIDLSNSIPDALASAAKQLRDYGWRRGKQWGFEVRVPQGINCIEASPDVKRPLADWFIRRESNPFDLPLTFVVGDDVVDGGDARSYFPAITFRASSTELGVNSRLTSIFSFAKNPSCWQAQNGQLEAPAKATTFSVSAALAKLRRPDGTSAATPPATTERLIIPTLRRATPLSGLHASRRTVLFSMD